MTSSSSLPSPYRITQSLSPSRPSPRRPAAIAAASCFHHRQIASSSSSLRLAVQSWPNLNANANASALLFQRKKRRTMMITKRRKQLFPVMEWQDCSAEIEIDVPCSVAYECYSDRETIPKWMSFISAVKVLQDKPDLSRWSLKYEIFGREVEFSWLARNLQPIPNQKIHWRSLDGLPNRGAVRFFPKGPSSCRIQLTVSYEIPEILIPVATAVKPFLEALLVKGLGQFAAFARERQRKIPQN